VTDTRTVLEAKNLTICLESGIPIVENIDLSLASGEILCLVGESGCGKTTTAAALLGYSAPGIRITAGTLEINGKTQQMDESMRASRGSLISYVPQNPGRALNPALRIRATIDDILRAHDRQSGRKAAMAILDRVGLDASPAFSARYPHQLSGGQQQRVCIAGSLACDPSVIVLDEPTTGLDVVTQSKILTELRRLANEQDVAMIYVTHDLAVASQIADRIAVMYAGRIVEQGPAADVLGQPGHPYTRGLLASVPDHVKPRTLETMPGIAVGVTERPAGCAFAPRCPLKTDACETSVPPLKNIGAERLVRCIHSHHTPSIEIRPLVAPSAKQSGAPVLEVQDLVARHDFRGGSVIAADGITFTVDRGSCVALVGESGSGKTTILRAVAGLHDITSGRLVLNGKELASGARRRSTEQRRTIQLISQNPADALNPRRTIGDSIGRPARKLRGLSRNATDTEVSRLLDQVRLPARVAMRYPAELSGGQRQRIAIARALAAQPEMLLCDEITSALDVSVQAAVLELLGELRRDLGLSILFITHDLGVVAAIADETLVLQRGKVCERGSTLDVLHAPQHVYTQTLLHAAPTITIGRTSPSAQEGLIRNGIAEPAS
jgi:peptide/nickel transport system ATP-binding protein